jgi:hypothetical protein
MKSFIEFLNKEGITDSLIKYYQDRINSNHQRHFIYKFLRTLQKELLTHDNADPSQNKIISLDLISKTYEDSRDLNSKKKLGEFYTPSSIVKYILDGVGFNKDNEIENVSIVDISCGAGSFLIEAVQRIVNRYKKLYSRAKRSDFSLKEIKIMINNVKKNVIGIDINPIACVLCQINVYYILWEFLRKIKTSELDYKFPIFNISNYNSLILQSIETYDYVVGNPPYLFIRDISQNDRLLIENGEFETNKGQYDYYQIFIELGIKLLKEGGMLGYIVPDSLLALSNRSDIRKFIYRNTKIREISHVGEKFDNLVVSNVILIMQKSLESKQKKENLVKISLPNCITQSIKQEYFKIWDYKFLIHLNQIDKEIIKKLNECFPKLRTLNKIEGFKIQLNRGVELSKNGKVVLCKKCNKYYPIPKKNLSCPECHLKLEESDIEQIIHEKIPKISHNKYLPFIYTIQRYSIDKPRYIEIEKEGVNYKNLDYYKDRIAIRQLNQDHMICATYIDGLVLGSQSLYNLKIKESIFQLFDNKYLLGLVNSKLMSYLFIKLFGSYKKLFPRVLIHNIWDFPIAVPQNVNDMQLALHITKNVNKLLNNRNHGIAFQRKIQMEIDNSIFKIYNINESEKNYIIEYMNKL